MLQTDYIHVPYSRMVHGEEEVEAVVNVLRTSTHTQINHIMESVTEFIKTR